MGSSPPSRRGRPLQLVAPVWRCPGEQCRLANRLCTGNAFGRAARAGCLYLAGGHGLGPLSRRRRHRVTTAARLAGLSSPRAAVTSKTALEMLRAILKERRRIWPSAARDPLGRPRVGAGDSGTRSFSADGEDRSTPDGSHRPRSAGHLGTVCHLRDRTITSLSWIPNLQQVLSS